MTVRNEKGMATAEYTVGTLGTVCIALLLYKIGLLGGDNPWFRAFKEVVEHALSWRKLADFIPGLGLKIH